LALVFSRLARDTYEQDIVVRKLAAECF